MIKSREMTDEEIEKEFQDVIDSIDWDSDEKEEKEVKKPAPKKRKKRTTKTKKPTAATKPTATPRKRKSKGHYTEQDIADENDRIFANKRWAEYEKRIDLTKPTNQTTIDQLIFFEREIKNTQERISKLGIDKESRTERSALLKDLSKLRDDFSRAANDAALLERQSKSDIDQEAIDAVIIRNHDIRPDWRDTQVEREMSIHNIYELYAQFHKMALNEGREPNTPLPTVSFRQEQKKEPVNIEMARREIEASEKGDMEILVESNE